MLTRSRLPLAGRVALVAGATRGSGRGIAVALGAAGATVYCTGRSTRANRPAGRPADAGPFTLAARPETVEETAKRVDAAGGRGIAVAVDHGDVEAVRGLIGRIDAEQGRLDVLVNDVWGGDELTGSGPFWEGSLENGLAMLRRAIETHVVTAHAAASLLVRTGGGLVVEVTDGDHYGYRGELFYDLVKTSVIRLAFALSRELGPRGVTALAVTPGFLRSEAMLEHFGVTEETWRDAVAEHPDFAESETPTYVGRCIAALAADPRVGEKAGRVHAAWSLGPEYGVTDVDGRQPDITRWIAANRPDLAWTPCDDAFYGYWGMPPVRSEAAEAGREAATSAATSAET